MNLSAGGERGAKPRGEEEEGGLGGVKGRTENHLSENVFEQGLGSVVLRCHCYYHPLRCQR